MQEVHSPPAPDQGDLDDSATPLCLRCLTPVSPLQHTCDHCGRGVGQFTPCLPLEFIPCYVEFFGKLWHRLWYVPKLPRRERWVYALLIILLEPIMLLGLPFTILRSRRHRNGLCLHCGYDLRGDDTTDRCPECGLAPDADD